ncbi:MAG: hypothetical protein JSS72_09745 [Armatimonadetes bacterium]|nr:hypothetical protein [Armatimonadota bacterium]
MPLGILLALALAGSHHHADWSAITDRFKSVAETYKKWGITFEVEGGPGFDAANGPLPGKLEISGAFKSDDSVEIKLATQVGERHALAFQLGGTYKIDANGSAREGEGGFFLEGTGISGKYSNSAEEGPKLEAAFEEALAKVGIQFGKAEEGPLAFGLKLGKLTIKIDPTKYAQHLREVGPTLIKKGEEKIGGITMEVDADAMAYALAGASAPPADFLQSRLAVSLGSLASGDLGELNDLQGVLLDEASHDIFLVGVHNPEFPAIPAERVATVVRAVYEAKMHPFISIDPQGGDFSKPNLARIGGIPNELRNSSLIQTMLAADYAMKQISVGTHPMEGVPDVGSLMSKYSSGIVPTRFWINPSPLRVGDVSVSSTPGRRFYAIRTSPVVLTQPLHEANENASANPFTQDVAKSFAQTSKLIDEEEASALTQNFQAINRNWPESNFGAAEQALQLTNIFSLLSQNEKDAWVREALHRFAQIEIPAAALPSSFPALRGPDVQVGERTTHIEGGVTTEIDLPPLVSGSDAILSGSFSPGMVDLGPPIPQAGEPTALSAEEGAVRAFAASTTAVRHRDFQSARDEARYALTLRPGWEDATCALLSALDQLPGGAEEFDKTLDQALAASPNSWRLLLFDAQRAIWRSEHTLSDNLPFRAQAIVDLNTIIQIRPDFAFAYGLRAKVQHRLQNDEESMSDWNEAIKREPLNPGYLYGRAGLLAGQGKLKEAEKDLNEALSINPKAAPALMARAGLRRRLKRLPEAIADARTLVAISLTDWEAYNLLGHLLFESGDDKGTVEAMTAALLVAPQDAGQSLRESVTGRKAYPMQILQVDRWEDFTKRSGDPVVPAYFVADNARFDPDMLLLRAKSYIHLKEYAKAKLDLEAFQDSGYGKPDEIKRLLALCAKGG